MTEITENTITITGNTEEVPDILDTVTEEDIEEIIETGDNPTEFEIEDAEVVEINEGWITITITTTQETTPNDVIEEIIEDTIEEA